MFQKSTGYLTGYEHIFKSKVFVDDLIKTNQLYKNGYPGQLISDGSAIVTLNHLYSTK